MEDITLDELKLIEQETEKELEEESVETGIKFGGLDTKQKKLYSV